MPAALELALLLTSSIAAPYLPRVPGWGSGPFTPPQGIWGKRGKGAREGYMG